MIKLLKYLKDYKKESIIGPLFKMTEATFELLVPLVMAQMIDVGIKDGNRPYIGWMFLALIGLGILGLVCSLVAQYFAAKAAVGFGTQLRNDLFSFVNDFSYREIDQWGVVTLTTRLTNDVNQVQTAVNVALRLLLRAPFIVLGALIMAFLISPKLAILYVLLIPVLSVAIFGIISWGVPLYHKIQVVMEQIMLHTRENIVGVRVVRAFAKQKEERDLFQKESDTYTKLQWQVGKISSLLNPLTYVIVNIAVILVLWFGGTEVDNGALSQGEMIALVNYLVQILAALVAFSVLIVNFSKGITSAKRLEELMEMKRGNEDVGTIDAAEIQGTTAVEMKNVSFRYADSEKESLQGINVVIKKGETVGIIGGTGSGKSTFINLIPRFYETSKGTMVIKNIPAKEYSLSSLRGIIGVVPQKSVLFSGTIRDNLKWGKKEATEDEMWKALAIAQGDTMVAEKKGGLDFYLREGGTNLSGGQKQRIGIARALVRNPEILILDDSCSALDFQTDANLRKALKENTEDMTVFLVSQRVSTVEGADRILVFEEGEIVGNGTHEELIHTCKTYTEIWESQNNQEVVEE